jgi:hypothetical protein
MLGNHYSGTKLNAPFADKQRLADTASRATDKV